MNADEVRVGERYVIAGPDHNYNGEIGRCLGTEGDTVAFKMKLGLIRTLPSDRVVCRVTIPLTFWDVVKQWFEFQTC